MTEERSIPRGTHSFWAPELVFSISTSEEEEERKEKVPQSTTTDVWALGMTIYVGSFGDSYCNILRLMSLVLAIIVPGATFPRAQSASSAK